jgi:two-component system sensor histidine kinase BarA
VVEDEPTIRELVSGMLEALGAKVVACERPQEALDLAKNDQFDVAFVDLVMPTMGGNEWVSNLRAQDGQSKSPKLPVVLMTGHGAGGEHNDSIHSVLPKPFTMDDLKASLRSVSEAKNE